MKDPDSNQLPPEAKASRETAEALVSQILSGSGEDVFSAREILDAHPALVDFKSCVIDLAYEEFCRRREHGEILKPTEFARQFSDVSQSLYRVIEFDQVLHDHPSIIEAIPEDRWPRAGEIFQGFELFRQIGKGALSRVFIAHQRGLGRRRVVVKICVRGEREADFLGKLEHDGIAPVHSVHPDQETGLVAICMPCVTYATLHHVSEWLLTEDKKLVTAAILRQRIQAYNRAQSGIQPADENESAQHDADTSALSDAALNSENDRENETLSVLISRWGTQLARALQYAHSEGILHCDVKPANVLIDEQLNASLLDFNLASANDGGLEVAGGTLPFMASEQLRQLIHTLSQTHPAPGDSPAKPDARTDIFGLCATLWFVLAGEPPYGVGVDSESRREAANELLQRQQQGIAADRVQQLSELASPALVDVLLRGLQADPDLRYSTAAELANALDATLPKPTRDKITERRRRTSRLAAIAALAAMAILTPVYITNPGLFTSVQRALMPFAGGGSGGLHAVDRIAELIRNGDLAAAQALIESDVPPGSLREFLRTAVQTVALEDRLPQATDFSHVEPASSLLPECEELLSRWKHLLNEKKFGPLAAYNLAFVEFELCQGEYSVTAETHLKTALAAGIQTSASRRVQQLLALRRIRKLNSADVDQFGRVVDELIREGTYGELYLAVEVIRRGTLNSRDNAKFMAVCDRILDVIQSDGGRTASKVIAAHLLAAFAADDARSHRILQLMAEQRLESTPSTVLRPLRSRLLFPGDVAVTPSNAGDSGSP